MVGDKSDFVETFISTDIWSWYTSHQAHILRSCACVKTLYLCFSGRCVKWDMNTKIIAAWAFDHVLVSLQFLVVVLHSDFLQLLWEQEHLLLSSSFWFSLSKSFSHSPLLLMFLSICFPFLKKVKMQFIQNFKKIRLTFNFYVSFIKFESSSLSWRKKSHAW